MKNDTDSLSASQEDYLKTIARIVGNDKRPRPKDISARLGVNMPSVTGALHALAQRGLVDYEPYGDVTLTDEGSKVAREVIRKHESVRSFLIKVLSMEDEAADKAACEMEHCVSGDVLERIVMFVDYLEMCPRIGKDWFEKFGHHYLHPEEVGDCERCLSICADDFHARDTIGNGANTTRLSEMATGRKARIVQITGNGETKRRIVDMGVTPGSLVEVERVAPMGDPIQVKIKGYHLSLRLNEASRITVDLI